MAPGSRPAARWRLGLELPACRRRRVVPLAGRPAAQTNITLDLRAVPAVGAGARTARAVRDPVCPSSRAAPKLNPFVGGRSSVMSVQPAALARQRACRTVAEHRLEQYRRRPAGTSWPQYPQGRRTRWRPSAASTESESAATRRTSSAYSASSSTGIIMTSCPIRCFAPA